MRTAVWIPRLSLASCLLATFAVGVRAQAANPPCLGPGPDDPQGSPGVAGWAGPPSVDGSLDDGAIPIFDGGGNILDYLGVNNQALPKPFAYSNVTAAYADATGCMAYDAQGHQALHDCLCQNCFSLIQQCDSLTSCRAILKCTQDAGCTTANACYLFPGAACTAVINQYGTGSVPTALDQDIGTCGQAAGCPAQ